METVPQTEEPKESIKAQKADAVPRESSSKTSSSSYEGESGQATSKQEDIKRGFDDLVQDSEKRNGCNIGKNDFQMLSVIGKGSYGKVLLVQKKDDGKLYAMKVLKKSELQRRN